MIIEEFDSVLSSEYAHLIMYRAVKDYKSEAATSARINDLLDRRSALLKYNEYTSQRSFPESPYLSHDELLDQEFAYISWDISCRSALRDDRCCQRVRGHKQGKHASGYGANRIEWAA